MTQGKVATNGLPPSTKQHDQGAYNHTVPAGAVPTSNSASKKKKKKSGKGKKSDEGQDVGGLPSSPTFHEHSLPSNLPHTPSQQNSFAPTAHDLLETASDLYRRIEADPQGIPDDEAYWSSLPSHLRTFIRNALPLGQFPTTNPADPSARQASTQAMIAVAQQLASAAHASQRHLEQYPPGSQPFSSIPFDPSIFADLALNADSGLPLHPHPNAATNGVSAVNPLKNPNAPVFRVNERGELEATGAIQADLDEAFYSDEEDEELEHDHHDHDRAHLADANGKMRDGVWIQQDVSRVNAPNGVVGAAADEAGPGSGNKKNKKKKKKKASGVEANALPPQPPATAPPRPTPVARPAPPPAAQPAPAPRAPAAGNPPPSSRAAGKQPMQPAANAPSSRPAQPRSGAPPSSTSAGKRPASNSGPAASAPAAHNGHAAPAAPANSGRIWSASSAEERERIKDFWLSLPENERRSLVKVEKDAVLRKMKEQQKHACACAVCGRKRNAIEDELEVLYDAYYDELENYANHQMQYVSSGGAIPPPPGPGPFPGSVALDNNGQVVGGESFGKDGVGARGPPQRTAAAPPPSKKAPPPPPPHHNEHLYDDDELEDDEYDDEDDYEDDEEEDDLDGSQDGDYDGNYKRPVAAPGRRTSAAPAQPPTAPPAAPPAANGDIFNFGSSLTVKGGILTVADDLLKNDGQKFLEMMEQLAERRMVREEDALNAIEGSEDEDDEEDDYIDDDEEEDDEEDEEDEEDEQDELITEEQRMEEGRRMFQIFAARMFEQRVLQAYREKVAQERQLQLLRELEEEDAAEKEREAKRAKENQKKKDKKKQQKQQKEEERLKRESEKAAEEAAAKAKIEKQREADLKRQDELRAKREAEKRAKDEEKARKEEEKRKRIEEERARELEKERKNKEKLDRVRLEKEAQEAKAREKKARDEELRREREVKEKEEKERKLRAEQDRRAAEAARKEKEAAEKAAASARAERQLQAQNQRVAAAAAAARAVVSPAPSSPARSFAGKAPVQVAPVSTAPPTAPIAPRSRNPSVSTSPSAPAATARGAVPPVRPAFGTATHRPPPAPATVSAAPSLPPQGPSSSLPAPPQGLPARPSAHAPSASPATSGLAPPGLPASLPRPPNSGQGFINPQATAAPPQPQLPPAVPQQQHQASVSSSLPSPGQTKASSPIAAPGAALPQPGARNYQPGFGAAAGLPPQMPMHGGTSFDSIRSPSTSSAGGPAGLGIVDSGMGSVRSPIDSLATSGIGNATSSLASLNLGTQPMGPPLVGPGYPQTAQMSNGIPPAQQGPHSRSQSISDGGLGQAPGGQQLPFRSGSSLSHRAIQRPAPGPIGPIGRPRPAGESEDAFNLAGFTSPVAGSSASSAIGGSSSGLWNNSSAKLPEGILGSSALGGDDEVVDPHPRRTSSTIPPISSGSGLGSANGSGFTSPFGGFSASSPWSAFPAHGSSHLGGSNVGGMGMGVGSPGMPAGESLGGQGSFANSDAAGVDLWSRPSTAGLNGWERARSAFEQPPSLGASQPGQNSQQPSMYGGGHLGQASQHSSLGPHSGHSLQHSMGGGVPQSPAGLTSPFNTAPRNIFAPPASSSMISPSILQPVSPQRGHGDRNGL